MVSGDFAALVVAGSGVVVGTVVAVAGVAGVVAVVVAVCVSFSSVIFMIFDIN